jgi:hypothetical protein
VVPALEGHLVLDQLEQPEMGENYQKNAVRKMGFNF